jgi:hypothetical protein
VDSTASALSIRRSDERERPFGGVSAHSLLTTATLVLALAVIWLYQLETRTLFYVLVITAIGFPIHAALPFRHRLAFFAALSFVGIAVAFGLWGGLWLVGAGGLLIGICHLRLAWGLRVALLVAVGAALAVGRAGIVDLPWAAGVWPILGSMFMFRLAVYMHSLKHDKIEPSVSRSLAYFFMLPNVAFPLFPVVDHATFAKAYYDRSEASIYETGIQWITRGLLHLLLYRFVYLYVLIPANEVLDLGDLVRFMLGTFLLYLRVSGQFHLIVGILYLFGFRLPETHNLYYLSSSFTDFWRRINIYWKDFMMKLVYYPSFFRLRRLGGTTALVVATLIVFATTWILHSYQWFWLRGGFPLTAQDGAFWAILGVLVVITALREARRGRDRSLGTRGWSLRLATQTVGTFIALCVLWSLWSAESLMEWMLMLGAAASADPTDLLWIGALALGALAVAGRRWGAGPLTDEAPASWLQRPYFRSPALLGVLLLAAHPWVLGQLPDPARGTLASLQEPRLNAGDAALQHQGYYEKLDQRGQVGAQLW